MKIDTKILLNLSLFFLVVGVLVGSLATRGAAKSDTAEPVAPMTAYVDLAKLLKEDSKLRREQAKTSAALEKVMTDLRNETSPKRRTYEQILKNNLAHTLPFVTAKMDLEKLELETARRAAQFEYDAQTQMKTDAIRAFKDLQDLARDTSRKLGYTQLLNIVLDLEKVADQLDDFRVLQQQLLLSPVLDYDKAHDLTEIVKAAADAKRALKVEMKLEGAIELDAEGKDGAEVKAVAKGEANPDEINWEVKLGQSIRFKAKITVNGVDVEDDLESVRLTPRVGDQAGKARDGKYTAPADFPEVDGAKEDVVVVRLFSKTDPNIDQKVKIRLVDKEGKHLVKKP
jgi:hypothetical protein